MSDRDIAAEGFDAGVAAATALCRAELAAMSERCLATMRKLNEQQTALTLEAVEAAYAGGWREGAEAMRQAAANEITGDCRWSPWRATQPGPCSPSDAILALPTPEPPKESP